MYRELAAVGLGQLAHPEVRRVVLDLAVHHGGELDLVEAWRVDRLAGSVVGGPEEARQLAPLVGVLEATMDAELVSWAVVLVVRLPIRVGHGDDVGRPGAEALGLNRVELAMPVVLAVTAAGCVEALQLDVELRAGSRLGPRVVDAACCQRQSAGHDQHSESQNSHTPRVGFSQSIDRRRL